MAAIKKTGFYFFVSLLLVLVYPLDIHFPAGNQSIYFFWGIKDTGFGFLANDFLASQPDPFPLFSFLVKWSSSVFGNQIFLFWYWLINLVYVLAFFELMDIIPKQVSGRVTDDESPGKKLILFLFLHSTLIWGFFFQHFFGIDLRWIWDSGFAEQGVLRGYFQPSCFGVFILLSLMFFARALTDQNAKGRNWIAAFVSASVAACFHANYLLVSAVVIAAYILILFRSRDYKTAVTGSVISLVMVLPYLIYISQNFSSSPETSEYIRQHIKGHIHFDHHIWLNTKAILQALLMVFSLWLMRKTVLFLPLLFIVISLVLLTIITYSSGSIFLMSLTPWRISVVLVPVAAAVSIVYLLKLKSNVVNSIIYSLLITLVGSALYFRIFGNSSADYLFKWRIFTMTAFAVLILATFIFHKYLMSLQLKMVTPLASVLLIVCLGFSGILLHKRDNGNEKGLVAFMKENGSGNQHYIIPPYLTGIRLMSGIPVFVDSAIYHSNSLPEWGRRIKAVNRVYSVNKEERSALLDSLVNNCGITDIIVPNDLGFSVGNEVFRNERYTIFELK